MGDIKTVDVIEFYKLADLWDYVVTNYSDIPNDIEGLLTMLLDEGFNYWNYSVNDKDEIKDKKNTVLVKDNFGDSRYFEIVETEEW